MNAAEPAAVQSEDAWSAPPPIETMTPLEILLELATLEPVHVITVRLPASLHATLKDERWERKYASGNKLWLDKLAAGRTAQIRRALIARRSGSSLPPPTEPVPPDVEADLLRT